MNKTQQKKLYSWKTALKSNPASKKLLQFNVIVKVILFSLLNVYCDVEREIYVDTEINKDLMEINGLF